MSWYQLMPGIAVHQQAVAIATQQGRSRTRLHIHEQGVKYHTIEGAYETYALYRCRLKTISKLRFEHECQVCRRKMWFAASYDHAEKGVCEDCWEPYIDSRRLMGCEIVYTSNSTTICYVKDPDAGDLLYGKLNIVPEPEHDFTQQMLADVSEQQFVRFARGNVTTGNRKLLHGLLNQANRGI